jgi:hypothetical protein
VPRIDPCVGEQRSGPPWHDESPKLGLLPQNLSWHARSEEATCKVSSRGKTAPAAREREAGPLAGGGAPKVGPCAPMAHQ